MDMEILEMMKEVMRRRYHRISSAFSMPLRVYILFVTHAALCQLLERRC